MTGQKSGLHVYIHIHDEICDEDRLLNNFFSARSYNVRTLRLCQTYLFGTESINRAFGFKVIIVSFVRAEQYIMHRIGRLDVRNGARYSIRIFAREY